MSRSGEGVLGAVVAIPNMKSYIIKNGEVIDPTFVSTKGDKTIFRWDNIATEPKNLKLDVRERQDLERVYRMEYLGPYCKNSSPDKCLEELESRILRDNGKYEASITSLTVSNSTLLAVMDPDRLVTDLTIASLDSSSHNFAVARDLKRLNIRGIHPSYLSSRVNSELIKVRMLTIPWEYLEYIGNYVDTSSVKSLSIEGKRVGDLVKGGFDYERVAELFPNVNSVRMDTIGDLVRLLDTGIKLYSVSARYSGPAWTTNWSAPNEEEIKRFNRYLRKINVLELNQFVTELDYSNVQVLSLQDITYMDPARLLGVVVSINHTAFEDLHQTYTGELSARRDLTIYFNYALTEQDSYANGNSLQLYVGDKETIGTI